VRIDIPIDKARIVALDIGPVLFELLTKPEARRSVQAGQKTFDGDTRDQFEIRETR
jgi:hypothetical protein